ncbi:acyl-CoA dehydratase activase [Hespellia stercorisuis]|uniref:CoA-substrate-specific enzyme activase, putative n=1 Tax=Hespellia stercorisuis DSM 15480 TaxID=1121950 RepID=A0A1M6RT32_9FIRM|nr:acyl-CoA dehydratase activase [Hespellia stercorisuis]SHK35437.1 CoA-substrate-specific enzyme activase, putative [Hespellia stercorisuis DSM 15480]
MNYIGIDIGSTCAKLAVLNEQKETVLKLVQPTGWSSVDTAEEIRKKLQDENIDPEREACVATGYGRIAVPYADKMITEITCHAKGAVWLHDCDNVVVIDIGGQDTKVIRIENGMVKDFVMNDKCSAGTGRFLEVMANSLALRPDEMCDLAASGGGTSISSMCTVFAESEVISLIGRGEKKENIAFAVVDSIATKVASQAGRFNVGKEEVCLTGGLCECDYIRRTLEEKLHSRVVSSPEGRFAGAYGAALSAMRVRK